MKHSTYLLTICDGLGYSQAKKYNAVYQANSPNLDRYFKTYPYSLLEASGQYVGLPDNQIGNSEVGHMNIGSGRIVPQDLPYINKLIKNQELKENPELQHFIAKTKKANNVVHILGLLSDGGVHSHIDHILELCQIISKCNIKIYLHCFLDGRDVAPNSAYDIVKSFQENINSISQHHNIEISSIMGRYYAMDRDNRWEKTKIAFDAIAYGDSNQYTTDFLDAIKKEYSQNISDEFIKPIINKNYQAMSDGDSLFIANFRADRIKQITSSFVDLDFNDFKKSHNIKLSTVLTMTKYSDNLSKYTPSIIKKEILKNSLGEILSKNNKSQLHIAETEKYAHITFFFNGGKEDKYKNEDHILIPSPKVKTYDLKPEMSAYEITEKLIGFIQNDKYDFIVVNFANLDMVGHTGMMDAAIKSVNIIDECLGKIEHEIIKNNGHMFITADHGNIEHMFNEDTNSIHTAHTINPVPFIYISPDSKNNPTAYKIKNGKLSDIAPTILNSMGIAVAPEMTGENLIKIKAI